MDSRNSWVLNGVQFFYSDILLISPYHVSNAPDQITQRPQVGHIFLFCEGYLDSRDIRRRVYSRASPRVMLPLENILLVWFDFFFFLIFKSFLAARFTSFDLTMTVRLSSSSGQLGCRLFRMLNKRKPIYLYSIWCIDYCVSVVRVLYLYICFSIKIAACLVRKLRYCRITFINVERKIWIFMFLQGENYARTYEFFVWEII